MAFSIGACIRVSLNPLSPLPECSSPVSFHWLRNKEVGWRRNTLAAAAVATIMTIGAASPAIEAPKDVGVESYRSVVASEPERWSDQRKCPPWHANSLENIMPENLPRPPPNRRSDGLAAYRHAPALAGATLIHRYKGGCYSM